MSLRRKTPHKDHLYSSQEFNISVRGSQRLIWKAAKYVTLRKIFKLWLFRTVLLIFFFFFWLYSPNLMSHSLGFPPWTKLREFLSSSSKKTFILEYTLKKIIYFVKCFHTSVNMQSPCLDDLMHIFIKVLTLLWDHICSKTVIYAI